MNITLTEQEINNKGWWENYCKMSGVDFYTTVKNDLEVKLTETEYGMLQGYKDIPEGYRLGDDSNEQFFGMNNYSFSQKKLYKALKVQDKEPNAENLMEVFWRMDDITFDVDRMEVLQDFYENQG